MEYKEKIIALLRQEIEAHWDNMQAVRKNIGAKEITIDEQLELLFNQRVNCGGYALEIDGCVFPSLNGNFEQIVSGIVDKLEFVRLLGDSELEPDEYIVVYRANNFGGHHFIKIKDGDITEKNECNNIQNFSKWPVSLDSSPEAVFAVRREHELDIIDDLGEKTFNICLDNILGCDFEQAVEQAILSGQITFNYHGHNYTMSRNINDNSKAFLISDDRVIGEVMVDGEECICYINDEEKDYVSNTKSRNTEYLKAMEKVQVMEI